MSENTKNRGLLGSEATFDSPPWALRRKPPMISFEDFKKLDIKIGKILSAEKIPDSEKLIKLVVDDGEGERQLIAGIGEAYPDVEELVGKEIPILANLEPKKLMGEMSEGMILAADNEGLPVLIHPDKEIPPGSIVR